jgi:hypothetical protein
MTDFYHAEDWDNGLRCVDCMAEFVEGQPIASRLISMTYVGAEPAYVVEIVCVPCFLGETVAA